MVTTLIVILIIILAFGLVIWAVATYLPLGQPFRGIIIVILALIALLIILGQVGVIHA